MRIVLLLVLAPSIALADPRTGNLRVAIGCAEGLATPDHGLVVRVDGTPIAATALDGHDEVILQPHGGFTRLWILDDVSFNTTLGAHRVDVAATSCASDSFETTIDPEHAVIATGRLALTDQALAGPTGAPNGGGVTIGAFTRGAIDGGMVSATYERRHLALAGDVMFGSGETDAGVNAFDAAMQVRIGARASSNHVAVAGGTGAGFELEATTMATMTTTPGLDASFYVPLWAEVTVKPVCDIGLQVLAQYDFKPSAVASSGAMLAVGFLIQPSDSCRQTPGIHLHSS